MIVYASPKAQGTDTDGNTQPVSVVGPHSDELKIADIEQRDILYSILEQLKILNLYMASMSDMIIDESNVER